MAKSEAMGGVLDKRGSKIFECTRGGVPTTFVETDIHCFRDLVQKLTGVLDSQKFSFSMPSTNSNKSSFKADMDSSTSIKHGKEMGPRKTAFKLQDRRNIQRQLEIKLGRTISLQGSPSPASNAHTILFQGNVLSPTFPSSNFHSPITPLGPDPFTSRNYSPSSSSSASMSLNLDAEEEFSFEKRPQREPKLLPLFPLHSTNS